MQHLILPRAVAELPPEMLRYVGFGFFGTTRHVLTWYSRGTRGVLEGTPRVLLGYTLAPVAAGGTGGDYIWRCVYMYISIYIWMRIYYAI